MRRATARRYAAVASTALIVAATVVASPAHVAALSDPIQEAIAASAAPGHTWQPEPAQYGNRQTAGVPIRMADGVVLRADIDVPTDPATKQPAPGPFPVLLTQTPYGKDVGGGAGLGTDPYLTD